MYRKIIILTLSACFVIAGPKKMIGKKSNTGISKTGKSSLTYLSVADQLLNSKNLVKALTKNEKKAVEDVKKNKKAKKGLQGSMTIRNFEAAIKKHKCFVPLSNKKSNLKNLPKSTDSPKWFKLDCSKSPKGKKGSANGSISPKSRKGSLGKTKSNYNRPK